MKIKKILSQNRRDFWADYECEYCGYIENNKSGYDDTYFHQNVIPDMKCPKCDKKGSELANLVKTAPKYSDNTII